MDSDKKIFSTVDKYTQKHGLFGLGVRIIVGFSGGPDSVFLLHYLVSLRQEYDLTIIAAHFDHEWRENSDQDRLFCLEYAQKMGVDFISQKASGMEKIRWDGSKEAQGRALRRAFFEDLYKRYDADFVALAHHSDDQLENFFIRVIRGTDLSGLVGMRPRAGIYIRPLLCLSKQEIIEYLHENKILYLSDSSNDSDKFLRNRIRKTVIPALQDCDDRFKTNCANLIERLSLADSCIDIMMVAIYEDLNRGPYGGIHVPKFLRLHEHLRCRILIHWFCQEKVSFSPAQQFFEEVVRFLNNKKSKQHQVTPLWSIAKKGLYAVIQKN
jgi:tRNA(Ile)-lysidine synthase